MLGMTLLSLVWPLKKRNGHGAFDQMTRQYSQATVQRNPPAQERGARSGVASAPPVPKLELLALNVS